MGPHQVRGTRTGAIREGFPEEAARWKEYVPNAGPQGALPSTVSKVANDHSAALLGFGAGVQTTPSKMLVRPDGEGRGGEARGADASFTGGLCVPLPPCPGDTQVAIAGCPAGGRHATGRILETPPRTVRPACWAPVSQISSVAQLLTPGKCQKWRVARGGASVTRVRSSGPLFGEKRTRLLPHAAGACCLFKRSAARPTPLEI